MVENVLMNVCRACLSEDGEFQSIFVQDEASGLNIHLAEMIMAYASVQITVGDGLPESICMGCAKKASKLYLFKKQCEEADIVLRTKLGKSPYVTKDYENIVPTSDKKLDLNLNTEDIIIKPEINDDNMPEPVDESDDDLLVENQNTEVVSWQQVNIQPENILDEANRQATKLFECDMCSKAFSREDLFVNHKKFHNFPKELKVVNVVPDEIVEEESDLNSSEQTVLEMKLEDELKPPVLEDGVDIILHVQSESKKGFECEECHKTFNKGSHLTRHMRIHAKIKPYACKLCNKDFARAEQLNNHLNMHSGIKPHVCSICSKGFNQISNLKDHMRTHNGEKPFLCSTCGKGFNQLGNLRQHTIRHSGIKAHLCSICGNGFASKGELCAHLRKHTGARPFVCPICNHGFTTSSSLTKHKRIHSGEKPYECEVCNMRFSRSGILARHRRTHTGEKPYVCKYCTKAFAQSNDLSSHLRIHTGEKPFICDVCGQAFRQSSALKTHKKTHMDKSSVVDSKVVIGMVPGSLLNSLSLKSEYINPAPCENIKVNFM